MSIVNELNSELAMAVVNRLKSGDAEDKKALLALLRQVHTTLRPLSKADRREKMDLTKSDDRLGASNKSH